MKRTEKDKKLEVFFSVVFFFLSLQRLFLVADIAFTFSTSFRIPFFSNQTQELRRLEEESKQQAG